MKLNKLIGCSVLSVLGSILLCGCMGGTTRSDTLPVPNRDLGMRFNYNSFQFQDNGMSDTLDNPFFMIDKARIANAANRSYPSIFMKSESNQAIPISVRVKQSAEELKNLGWAVIPQSVWLFASLGILPMYVPTYDFQYDIEVDFNSRWGKKIYSGRTSLMLHENYWLGSLPFFFAFYSSGKISIDENQKILDFSGPAGTHYSMKSDFIAGAITDAVTRLILEKRKELMLKILLSDVQNRWGILIGHETDHAFYASDDARILHRELLKKAWRRTQMKLFSGRSVLKNDLEGALENYLGNAKENDLILLFISGEIYQDPARPDDVYLVCADTDRREIWSGYKISEIFSSLKEARTPNVVIMLDVCRKPYSQPILTENYLRRLGPLPKWMILANETVKRSENDSSGPLVRMIRQGEAGKADSDGDRIISLRELASWLRRQKKELQNLIVIYPSGETKLADYPLSNQ